MTQAEKLPFVDAHAHIWTRDIEQFPLAPGRTLADLCPASFTAEDLLDTAHAFGVGRLVLIQHYPFHGNDNSYVIDAAERYPGTFRVVGMIDERRPDLEATMRALLNQHVTGFRISPSATGAGWLTTPEMARMWQCAAETGQAICCHINPGHLPEVDRACEHNPDTSVVIDHLCLIGTTGAICDTDVERLCRLARHAQVTVKASAFYALGRKQPPHDELIPMIRRLLDAFGSDRLMWASDAPYQLNSPNTYAASLALIQERLDYLSSADRQNLLRNTAERVFGFGETREG